MSRTKSDYFHSPTVTPPEPTEALRYLAAHHLVAAERLALELMTADSLRRHAAHHDDVRFDEAPELTETAVRRGEVDIWQYAARVTLALQDSIDNAESAVLNHHGIVLAGYLNDVTPSAVAAQLDWFI